MFSRNCNGVIRLVPTLCSLCITDQCQGLLLKKDDSGGLSTMEKGSGGGGGGDKVQSYPLASSALTLSFSVGSWWQSLATVAKSTHPCFGSLILTGSADLLILFDLTHMILHWVVTYSFYSSYGYQSLQINLLKSQFWKNFLIFLNVFCWILVACFTW